MATLKLTMSVNVSPETKRFVAILERLCDELTKAVTPEGGYEPASEYEGGGAQIVGGERWEPRFGCDSLEQTLDSIKGRLATTVYKWAIDEMKITTEEVQ